MEAEIIKTQKEKKTRKKKGQPPCRPAVTPSNRAYAALAIPAKLRIEPIRRRPPNITCTENAHPMRVNLITNGYIAIVTIDPKGTYIFTTTTPTSQDTNRYNTKIQITAESGTVSEYEQESSGLSVLKINDVVHSLPRPSRKGNLANVIKHKPATKATCANKKRERSR